MIFPWKIPVWISILLGRSLRVLCYNHLSLCQVQYTFKQIKGYQVLPSTSHMATTKLQCAGDARMQAASTHRCSLRRVSRPSSHCRRAGCSWAQCLEKGRKARETRSENYKGKQTNLGIQFVFCFCSAQNINYSTHAKHTAKLYIPQIKT